jgi:two-component system sensor histidine kinase BaeS
LVLLILVIIISIPLSRHFVKPIRRLEESMRLLNQGNFDVKLAVTGKDELASLSLNFNDLASTLEQNESSRNKWLANVSHELRTPLAIIKGEIEAMQDGIRPLNIENLSSLSEEVIHLQKLINDLGELSNAEIGAMRYQKQRLNLVNLVEQNLVRHQQYADQTNFKINIKLINSKLLVWADETRINQLIDNIIKNSFKYTDSPGTINVELSTNDNNAVVIIEDSAPNVPEELLDNLFEHLYRVENSRNRKTGGSGIGLALCKNIVEAHQGTISAYQSPLGGIGIRCTLPLVY